MASPSNASLCDWVIGAKHGLFQLKEASRLRDDLFLFAGVAARAEPALSGADVPDKIGAGDIQLGRAPCDFMTSALKEWRRVALPAEHGGWSLVLEPILLGLLVAFSWPGLLIGLGAFLAFLAFQPFRVLLRGLIEKRTGGAQKMAWRWTVIYGSISILAIVLGLTSSSWRPLNALIAAIPFVLIYFYHDILKPSRSWLPESSGALVFSAVTAAIGMAGGLDLYKSLALSALMAARGVPSVAYIRARIRLEKGRLGKIWPVMLIQLLALGLVLLLFLNNALSWGAVVAILILVLRALLGLSRFRWERSIRMVGLMEMGYGLLFIFLAASVRS